MLRAVLLVNIVLIIVYIVYFAYVTHILGTTESFSLNPVLDASISAPMWNLGALQTISPRSMPLDTAITSIIGQKLRTMNERYIFLNYNNISAVPNGPNTMLIVVDFWLHELISATTHRFIMQLHYDISEYALRIISFRPATRSV